MTTYFDQRGQTVHGSQTNVSGNVDSLNVSAATDLDGLISVLERLGDQVGVAARDGSIDPELATEVEYQVSRARDEATWPEPDRGRFLDHVSQAESLLKAGTAAAGLITALEKVAESAHLLFR